MNYKGFCVMYTYDVALSVENGDWDGHYTANKSQHSDDSSMIMITGIRESCVMEFNTAQEMKEWCYENGWTKPVEGEL